MISLIGICCTSVNITTICLQVANNRLSLEWTYVRSNRYLNGYKRKYTIDRTSCMGLMCSLYKVISCYK